MPIKHKVTKIEEAPEALRSFYEQSSDGAFYLQVEGMVPKTQVDEFRENNITLMRERDALLAKYKDVDPVKYQELLAANAKTPEAIETAVRARLAEMSREHETKVSELTATNQTLKATLDTVLIDGTLKSEAAKAGVLPTAIDDIVFRGRTVFKTENGQPVAYDEKGQKLYDKDGTSNLSVSAWMKNLKQSAPHLFAGFNGGGAGGAGGRGPGTVDLKNASPVQKIAAGLAQLGSRE